jgi:hypothetical protein
VCIIPRPRTIPRPPRTTARAADAGANGTGSGSGTGTGGGGTGPGGAVSAAPGGPGAVADVLSEAERRKQRAMEALNRRLASMAEVGQIPLDEEAGTPDAAASAV